MMSSDTLTILVGLVGILIGSVSGFAIGYYFYRKGRQVRAPVWDVGTLRHTDSVQATSYVWFSNRGTIAIDGNDVLEPLRILPGSESTQLSEAAVLYQKRKENFGLNPIARGDLSQGWEVNFKDIEPKDFVLIDVQHVGAAPTLSGWFKGENELRRMDGAV